MNVGLNNSRLGDMSSNRSGCGVESNRDFSCAGGHIPPRNIRICVSLQRLWHSVLRGPRLAATGTSRGEASTL